MLWFFLASRNRHSWSTGALDRFFAFMCAHCGAQLPAMVRTVGYATGSSLWAAQQAAQAAADGNAYRAVAAAGCPHCGQLQPTTLEGYRLAGKRSSRRRWLRFPLAGALAVVVLLLLIVPAIHDLHESPALAVVTASCAASVFALVFALCSLAVPTPSASAEGVWFSRDPLPGPSSWFPAQPGPAPLVEQPGTLSRVLATATFGFTTLVALVALVMWGNTFRNVYVISAERGRGELVVSIDGAEAGRVGKSADGHDAPFTKLEVRTSTSHHVVVKDAQGASTSYDLDPEAASQGWAITPHGKKRGLCLASLTSYYGTKPKDNDDKLLNEESDVAILPRSFDLVLTPAPKSISTKQSSETRTALRALDCSALDRDKYEPFDPGTSPR